MNKSALGLCFLITSLMSFSVWAGEKDQALYEAFGVMERYVPSGDGLRVLQKSGSGLTCEKREPVVRQPIPSFYCVLDENARYDELYDLIKVPEKKVAGRLTCTKTNLGSSCSLSD